MKRFIAVICLMVLLVTSVFAASPLEQEVFSENDFAYSYDGSRMVFNSAMYGYSRKGYLTPEQLDAERGDSLKIGIASPAPSGETSSPYVVIEQKTDTNLTVNFSVYLSGTCDYRMAVYKAKSDTESKEVNILRWQDKLTTAGKSLDFNKEQWYRVCVKFDLEEHYYSVYIDDEAVAENFKFTDISVINSLRFYGHTKEANEGFMAIDDITMSVKSPPPSVSQHGYDGENEGSAVPASAKTIEFYLNTPMYSITESQTHLYMNGVTVPYNRFGYDSENGVIAIDTDGCLYPNTTYELVIDADAEVYQGAAVGETITYKFTTMKDNVSLIDTVFEQTDSNVRVNAYFENPYDAEAPVTVIAAVWDGDLFVKMNVFNESILPGEDSHEYDITAVSAGQRIEMYVWDSFWGDDFLADRIYTCTAE